MAALAPPQPHGNAFWNSGLLDNAANTSRPPSSRLRFTKTGDYEFICLLHPDMKLKVTVVDRVSRDPDTSEAVPRFLTQLVRNHDASFGILGRPLTPASIRVGDPVKLL